jgi:hypothetical protein
MRTARSDGAVVAPSRDIPLYDSSISGMSRSSAHWCFPFGPRLDGRLGARFVLALVRGQRDDGDVDFKTMQPLKAHVKKGRLVLDEPTDLPEGTEVQVTIVDDDEMRDEERARLHAALERSMAQAKAGKLTDADEVIGRLLSRE